MRVSHVLYRCVPSRKEVPRAARLVICTFHHRTTLEPDDAVSVVDTLRHVYFSRLLQLRVTYPTGPHAYRDVYTRLATVTSAAGFHGLLNQAFT